MPYKTGKLKGELKAAEIRKLIKAHNKINTIKIPPKSTRDDLIKLVEKAGYRVNHKGQNIIRDVKRKEVIGLKGAEKMFPKKVRKPKKVVMQKEDEVRPASKPKPASKPEQNITELKGFKVLEKVYGKGYAKRIKLRKKYLEGGFKKEMDWEMEDDQVDDEMRSEWMTLSMPQDDVKFLFMKSPYNDKGTVLKKVDDMLEKRVENYKTWLDLMKKEPKGKVKKEDEVRPPRQAAPPVPKAKDFVKIGVKPKQGRIDTSAKNPGKVVKNRCIKAVNKARTVIGLYEKGGGKIKDSAFLSKKDLMETINYLKDIRPQLTLCPKSEQDIVDKALSLHSKGPTKKGKVKKEVEKIEKIEKKVEVEGEANVQEGVPDIKDLKNVITDRSIIKKGMIIRGFGSDSRDIEYYEKRVTGKVKSVFTKSIKINPLGTTDLTLIQGPYEMRRAQLGKEKKEKQAKN